MELSGDSVIRRSEPVQPEWASWKIARAAFHANSFTVRPEAYWNAQTRELIAYNMDFAELLQLPDEILRSGFLWSDIDLRLDAQGERNATFTIEREHNILICGLESNARFVIALERLQQSIFIFATAVGCEVHWLCVPQSEADTLVAHLRGAPTASATTRSITKNATPFDGNLARFLWKKTAPTRRRPKTHQ